MGFMFIYYYLLSIIYFYQAVNNYTCRKCIIQINTNILYFYFVLCSYIIYIHNNLQLIKFNLMS